MTEHAYHLRKAIWIYLECDGSGYLRKEHQALLQVGRRLSSQLMVPLAAVMTSSSIVPNIMPKASVDTRFRIIHQQLSPTDLSCLDYLISIKTNKTQLEDFSVVKQQLACLLLKYTPSYILFANTPESHTLALHSAVMTERDLVLNCRDYHLVDGPGEGSVPTWHCSRRAGEVTLWHENRMTPQSIIIDLHSLPSIDSFPPFPGYSPVLITESFDENHSQPGPRLLTAESLPALQPGNLRSSNVVVAGGRGTQGEKGFSLIRQLASELNGAVGASRLAVEMGWAADEDLVGQSGAVIAPDLYIACGISGSIQHLSGISKAKCIIAVNEDPLAPIFKYARYGILGDLFTILPILIKSIQRRKR
ncbi:MAG: electron transfer flavoprotein subunit alpha/FixB family protein [Eubacterium sp.]|nr:electron transfer flavoprotein subunit alpha/FixB family protein [Eubacterium sp.]